MYKPWKKYLFSGLLCLAVASHIVAEENTNNDCDGHYKASKYGDVTAGKEIRVDLSLPGASLYNDKKTSDLGSFCVNDDINVTVKATDEDDYVCKAENIYKKVYAKLNEDDPIDVSISCGSSATNLITTLNKKVNTKVSDSWLGCYGSITFSGNVADVDCKAHGASCKDPPVDLSSFSATFAVPKVDRIEYKWGEMKWTAASPTNYVPIGTNVYFRAVPCPEGVAWPNGKPAWKGVTPSSVSETKTIFTAPGFYDITAECGNVVTAKMCVVEMSLIQLDSNFPISPINRMCSNARDSNFKDVTYQLHLKPDILCADLIVTGTATVTFQTGANVIENVSNGAIVKLTANDNTTGSWTLTANASGVNVQVEEKVFKLVMLPYDLDPQSEPYNAGPLGTIVPIDAHTKIGFVRYTKLALVRPEPDVPPKQKFLTSTYVDIHVASAIEGNFRGRTYVRKAVKARFLSSSTWQDLVALTSVCSGPAGPVVSAVDSCVRLLLKGVFLQGPPHYTKAGGVGKPLADFEHSPLTAGPFTVVPPMVVDGCDGLPEPVYEELPWPYNEKLELPAGGTTIKRSGSSGTWCGQLYIGRVYSDVKLRNEIHFKFESEAPYDLSYSGMSTGNPKNKRYAASGVDVLAAGGAVLLLEYTQPDVWDITPIP